MAMPGGSHLRDVKARLGAARLVLARRGNTPEAHQSVSSLQKAAVLEVVSIAKMSGTASAGELAEIATSAVDINFAPGDLEEVLAAMTCVKLAGPPSKRPIDRTNIATVSLGRILKGLAGKRAGQAPRSPVSSF